MEVNEELITQLADDVWELAVEAEAIDGALSQKIKTLSGCLHDIRAGRDTKWYETFN